MVVSNEVKICCWGPLAFFGLVIFVPVFVIVPVQSIFFVAFIVIIYFLIKKNKSDKLAENLNKFDELDKKIKELLVGFAKRNYGVILNVTKLVNFGQKQTALELSEKEHFNENELNMLIQVLERKEFEVEKKELIYLIVSAFYYEFKGLIKKQYSGIKTAEKIVDRFFEEYEDQSLSNTEFLWLILDVKGFETDQENKNAIIVDLTNRIKEMELNIYEMKLKMNESKLGITDLDDLNGYEFEEFLKELFVKMNYVVEQTKLSGDQGADLVATKFGEKFVIQAKRYSNKVTNKAIQEVVASIQHYGADSGLVVTTNYYTKSAKELANSNNVELIDRGQLEKLMEKYL